jgi:SNF2 family DNA or RNA helicase
VSRLVRPLAHAAVKRVGELFGIFPLVFFRDQQRKQAWRKAAAGGRWDRRHRMWLASPDKVHAIVRRLRESGFAVRVDDDALSLFETREAGRVHDLQLARDRIRRLDAEMRRRGLSLYPFQVTGAEWLAQRDRALLGDQMGLGKTIQALAAVGNEAPVLVVCPASIKGVWAREFARWRPAFKISVLSGADSFRWPAAGEVVVINYDVLPDPHGGECPARLTPDDALTLSGPPPECHGCSDAIRQCPQGVVTVTDEAHKLRGSDTLRSIRFRAVAGAARARGGRTWLLSGTPLVNRPPELWNVLEAADLALETFASKTEFNRLFGGKPRYVGKQIVGTVWSDSPLPEAAERLASVMLRRMRADVLSELPPRTWKTVPVELGDKDFAFVDETLALMGMSASEVADAVDKGRELNFRKLSAARAALAAAKARVLVEYIRTEFEEADEPVVVFSAHRAPIDLLAERAGWRAITGSVAAKKRSQIEDEFQAGKLKGVALTIGAGAEGLTLTRASSVVFVDRDWTPAANAQAEDRIYRIGQRAAHVFVHDLVTAHPLDQRVTEVLVKKAKLIAESVDAAAERSA